MPDFKYRNPPTVRAVQWRGDNLDEVKDELATVPGMHCHIVVGAVGISVEVRRNLGAHVCSFVAYLNEWIILDKSWRILSDADFRATFIVEGESEEANMFWDADPHAGEMALHATTEEEAVREVADCETVKDGEFRVVLHRAKKLPTRTYEGLWYGDEFNYRLVEGEAGE